MLTTRPSRGAFDPNDPASEPDPACATEIAAQSGQLPVAVFGLFRDCTTQVPGGDVPAEDQNAILILDHHAHSGPERDTFKS